MKTRNNNASPVAAPFPPSRYPLHPRRAPLPRRVRLLISAAVWLALISAALAGDPVAEVTDALLDAVAAVESGGRNVPGDGGRAAGVWQLHAAACRDVGATHAEAWDPERAREIALCYLTWLGQSLRGVYQREPSVSELYAAYNLGRRGFARRGFRLDRCPHVTRSRAALVSALYDRQLAEVFERMAKDMVDRGRRLEAGTRRRADGGLELAEQSRTGVPPVQSSINGQAGSLSYSSDNPTLPHVAVTTRGNGKISRGNGTDAQ